MEFQAVICCGKGKMLSPFSALRPNGTEKALLPIANKPMVHYSLEWCDKAPFHSILIVAGTSSTAKLEEYVEQEYKTQRDKDLAGVNIEVYGTDTEGTGNIVYELHKLGKLTRDFVLLPCDFVTDLPPQILTEQYRNKDPRDLAMCVYYRNTLPNMDDKKNSNKHYYTCYTKTKSGESHLLDIYSQQNIDKSKFLSLRSHMLWRNPQTVVSTKLLDSFIYFCSYKMLQILSAEEYNFEYKSCTKIMRDVARRSWRHSDPRERINMLVLPKECTFARADNVTGYLESNRWIMHQLHMENIAKLQSGQIQHVVPPKKDKTSPNVGPESIVAESSVLGERTNVKKSIVGKSCTIGKRCKIVGSIIMDNVTLSDDVMLENCVVGSNVKIESKSRLINCNLENGYLVIKNSSVKGETLLQISLSGYDNRIDEESEDGSDEESDEESDDETDEDFVDDLDGDDIFER